MNNHTVAAIFTASVTPAQIAKVKALDSRFSHTRPTVLFTGFDAVEIVPDGSDTRMVTAQWGHNDRESTIRNAITIGILSDGSSHS